MDMYFKIAKAFHKPHLVFATLRRKCCHLPYLTDKKTEAESIVWLAAQGTRAGTRTHAFDSGSPIYKPGKQQ